MPKLKLKDVDISFTIDDYTDPWKRAPWVLMHHAIAGSSRQWYAWVPYLARHYKVLRYDARGHGDSTWPASNGHFSIDTLVEDAVAVMNTLSITRAHFIGASGGGAVGLKLAQDYPGRARSLTLVAATPKLADAQVDISRWGELMDKLGVEGWLTADAETRFPKADPKLVQWYAEEGARTSVAVAKLATAAMATVDLTPNLQYLRLPTLIQASDNDDIAPLKLQELMRDSIKKSVLKVYPGLGHNIQLLIPDLLAQDALAHLKRADEMEDLAMNMSNDC